MKAVLAVLCIAALLLALLAQFNIVPWGKALLVIIVIMAIIAVILSVGALVLLHRASHLVDDLIE